MSKGETAMHEMLLHFDERNLAHLLSALALAGIADEVSPCEASRCRWRDDAFWLRVPIDQNGLFKIADAFLRNIKWIAGIGIDTSDKNKRKITASPHHGLFSTDARHFGNPLISYHDQGTTSSLFKTFSGQKGPDDILDKQVKALVAPVTDKPDEWLFQRAKGVASWKFDARVGGHAYSQGFSANDEDEIKKIKTNIGNLKLAWEKADRIAKKAEEKAAKTKAESDSANAKAADPNATDKNKEGAKSKKAKATKDAKDAEDKREKADKAKESYEEARDSAGDIVRDSTASDEGATQESDSK
ncbi:MAG TPA: hypothetical protein VMF08_01765 [Candidatus Sulfotelmatobacter sp.]|nr:hypothetical protein [Candidatus Sulfotelmatobacter sp.]